MDAKSHKLDVQFRVQQANTETNPKKMVKLTSDQDTECKYIS